MNTFFLTGFSSSVLSQKENGKPFTSAEVAIGDGEEGGGGAAGDEKNVCKEGETGILMHCW